MMKESNGYQVKPMFSVGPSVFVLFVCNDGGFEFAPASNSPASVSDHGATNKDFTKVEHLQTGSARLNFLTVKSPTMFFAFFIILVL